MNDTKPLYARYFHPDAGYLHDHKQASKDGLVVGKRYLVSKIIMSQTYTSVYLGDKSYSSVLFEFEDEDGSPHNIYRDPEYNPYISKR